MMKIFKKLNLLRLNHRGLRETFFLYFIPIAILPLAILGYYVNQRFESYHENLIRLKAMAEKEAFIQEIDSKEAELVSQARLRASDKNILLALSHRNESALRWSLIPLRLRTNTRIYTVDGKFIAGRIQFGNQINYLPKEALSKIKVQEQTVERVFSDENQGVLSIVRVLLKGQGKLLGVLEEEFLLGTEELLRFGTSRQADLVLLQKNFQPVVATFAIPKESLGDFSKVILSKVVSKIEYKTLGESRYAVFLYEIPYFKSKNKSFGYLALYLSMNAYDSAVAQLKQTLLTTLAILTLLIVFLVFWFSNRIVKSVEMLVLSMKKVRGGQLELAPSMDAPYEIEYLVQSFNEMALSIARVKKNLEEKVIELHEANAEIKSTQGTLVQSAKMISLGQLVAGVAHELNNPIGFIHSNMHHLLEYVEKLRSYVEVVRRNQESLPEAARSEMDEIEKKVEIDFLLKDMEELTQSCVDGARRTKDIVLGLRSFSRIEGAEFGFFDVHEGITSTLKLLASDFKDRIQLHEEYGNLPKIECNLSQLNQVFMNLISNALQAIEGRGHLWIRTRSLLNKIEVEIEDSGQGIDSENLSKIFDPFYTTKKVGQGTGLGLSIAYGIIQKHQGQISVKSELGKGTLFKITLPMTQAKNEDIQSVS